MVSEISGGSGSYNVILKINDEVVATKEVTLDVNASEEVTFTIDKQEAGGYKVEVNGLVVSLSWSHLLRKFLRYHLYQLNLSIGGCWLELRPRPQW